MSDEQEMAYEQFQQNVIDRLRELGLLEDGEIMTGCVLVYETADAKGVAKSGYLSAPEDLSTWRAVGLLEWNKNFLLS